MGWMRKRGAQQAGEQPRTPLRVLYSPRMTLVAATTELVQADLAGCASLAAALEARVSDNWPPDLYEIEPMKQALRRLADPAEHGWSFWYLLGSGEERDVLGICGFKGRPDAAGSVEIAYSVLPQYRNRGFASEAVERLLSWAFSHHNVVEVTAETLPHLQQSIRVMKKNGFSYRGEGSERGVVRYAVSRPDRY
jgi:ribosomal-protein-alanine N-acetyltransferase